MQGGGVIVGKSMGAKTGEYINYNYRGPQVDNPFFKKIWSSKNNIHDQKPLFKNVVISNFLWRSPKHQTFCSKKILAYFSAIVKQ